MHLNVSSRAYLGSCYARWGKEVDVVSLAGRLDKFGPFGHSISAIRTQLVSIAGPEASGS